MNTAAKAFNNTIANLVFLFILVILPIAVIFTLTQVHKVGTFTVYTSIIVMAFMFIMRVEESEVDMGSPCIIVAIVGDLAALAGIILIHTSAGFPLFLAGASVFIIALVGFASHTFFSRCK